MEKILSGDVKMWAYNITVLAGTAYLVGWCAWNPWWFLFALCCLASQTKKCKCCNSE